MFALLATALLLLTPLIMVIIRLVKPGFAWFWLVAVLGALAAWPLMLLSGLDLPQARLLVAWEPTFLFSASPAILVDSLSWPYALALAGIAAGVILTAVARMPYVNWPAWSAALLLAGIAVLAVLAGNPLTLLLAWAALDLAELVILLLTLRSSALRERAVISFSARAAGILLLISAGVAARAQGQPLTFEAVPPLANLLLILAAGLRLGVLPLHFSFFSEAPLRRGLGTMLRLSPAAGSLVLLSRAAQNPLPELAYSVLLVLTALASVYTAALWSTARDELNGRSFWILTLASLAVASAVLGQPGASQAWGLILLLSGAILFLYSARRPPLLLLLLVSALFMSGLPFTPSWEAMRLYTSPIHPLMGLYLLAHALLLVGYYRHAFRPGDMLPDAQRWVWVIYPLGLALLLVSHLAIHFRAGLALADVPFQSWIAGGLAVLLSAGLGFLNTRLPALPSGLRSRLELVLSLQWLYRPAWVFYKSTGWVVARITDLLEGEGGVLWALVVLALLFSILRQSGLGN
jgi:hypothetical protein